MPALPTAPTPAELQLLRVPLEPGPEHVREVHDALYAGTETGYTTTLKLMQNLLAKHPVKRDEGQRQHIYPPWPARTTPSRGGARVYWSVPRGSAAALAMHARGQAGHRRELAGASRT
ncbi:MAG: BlaI/MecI/CopY family transcriptional regulator [Gemmatimonadales bacterium]